MDLDSQQRGLILDWMRKLHTLEYAHRYASVNKDRLNLFLGVPAVVIAGLIAAQESTPWQQSKVAQFGLAIGASVVTLFVGLQTFFKPTEIAEKHRAASATYESLRHRLELLLVFHEPDKTQIRTKLAQLKSEWDKLETPNVTAKVWNRAKAQVDEVGTYPRALRLAEPNIPATSNEAQPDPGAVTPTTALPSKVGVADE